MIWLAMRNARSRLAYASYGIERAYRVSHLAQELAERACGESIDGARDAWRLPNKSELKFTGIGGKLTGEPVDSLLTIDDPIKDRAEADSAVMRQKALDWYGTVALTRCHPRASRLVVATRWHPDDIIGYLAGLDDEFEVINLPAINDGTDPRRELGEPLWPSQRPLPFLENIRDGGELSEHDWCSLYMGQPRPRGSTVFGEPAYYDELPKAFRTVYGVDLAYTEKTYADFSVCVRLFVAGNTCYVHEVRRAQHDAPRFAETLKAMYTAHPGRMMWHCSGSEKGSAQFLQKLIGPKFQYGLVNTDKFQRAQPAAAAWNANPPRILLPNPGAKNEDGSAKFDTSWLQSFINEVCNFTGVGDTRDDQVDALASAYTAATRTSQLGTITQPLF